jgi:hypothetical protein
MPTPEGLPPAYHPFDGDGADCAVDCGLPRESHLPGRRRPMIRMDTYTRARWHTVAPETRALIEAAIPEGWTLTIAHGGSSACCVTSRRWWGELGVRRPLP